MSLGRKVNGMNTDGKPEEKVQHLPKDAKQWAMVAHLISLAGLVVIVIGFSLGPFIILGIVLELAVLVCAVIFPIIGAARASSGIHYRYPFAIRFIK
jgi:uncharacterized Tic20 family protein